MNIDGIILKHQSLPQPFSVAIKGWIIRLN